MKNVFERISEYGIVPLVTLDDPKDAVPLGRALLDGGIPIAEVTFRTAAGGESIKQMARELPDLIVGAGTVHDVEHVKITVDNGGKFVITPGFNHEVVKYCTDNNIPVCPGTVVPSDIEEAMNLGLSTVKFFPAEAYGGINTLKALAGPFGRIKFVPTGGVNLNNLQDYLNLPNVAAVGGSFIPPSKLVKAKDWAGITSLCHEIMAKVFDFSVARVGLSAPEGEAKGISEQVARIFGRESQDLGGSYLNCGLLEVAKGGNGGFVTVRTRDLPRALALFERKGVAVDQGSAKKDDRGQVTSVSLKDKIGGLEFRLMQCRCH